MLWHLRHAYLGDRKCIPFLTMGKPRTLHFVLFSIFGVALGDGLKACGWRSSCALTGSAFFRLCVHCNWSSTTHFFLELMKKTKQYILSTSSSSAPSPSDRYPCGTKKPSSSSSSSPSSSSSWKQPDHNMKFWQVKKKIQKMMNLPCRQSVFINCYS